MAATYVIEGWKTLDGDLIQLYDNAGVPEFRITSSAGVVKTILKLAQQAHAADVAAITAAALTGTMTGTNDGAINDITYNSTWSSAQANEINANFKEFQTQTTAIIADVTAVRTKVNAILALLETAGLVATS